jgi:teichuronic acid biosynthesis glycosyltransferase TuaC
MKLKVLFVTNLYPTIENPDFGVFTRDQIENIKAKKVLGDVLFINAMEKGPIEYLRAIKKINQSYKKYDLIHCFHGLTLIITYISTFRKPILISFLNEIKFESYKKNKIINKFFILIYNAILKSNRVFIIFKDKIPANLNLRGRSFYLPNGIDLSDFYPIKREIAYKKLNLDINKTYILFVSSKAKLRGQKRYDIFRRTIQILKENSVDLNFEELILTNIPRELCNYYYNAASVHLVTSDYEGSPNSVKEAMGCNIPVVSTDVGNVKKMIVGATNCFISDQDPAKLALCVLKAIQSPFCDLRKVLVDNGLTVENKTEELSQIYSQIVQRK